MNPINPYEQTVRIVTVFFSAVTGLGLKELLSPGKFGCHRTIQALCFAAALLLLLRFLFGSANHLWAEANGLFFKRHYRTTSELEKLNNCPAARLFAWHLFCLIIYFGLLMRICYAENITQFLSLILGLNGLALVLTAVSPLFERDSMLDLTRLWLWANGIQAVVTLLVWQCPAFLGLKDKWRLLVLVIVFLAVLLWDVTGQLIRLEQLSKKLENP